MHERAPDDGLPKDLIGCMGSGLNVDARTRPRRWVACDRVHGRGRQDASLVDVRLMRWQGAIGPLLSGRPAFPGGSHEVKGVPVSGARRWSRARSVTERKSRTKRLGSGVSHVGPFGIETDARHQVLDTADGPARSASGLRRTTSDHYGSHLRTLRQARETCVPRALWHRSRQPNSVGERGGGDSGSQTGGTLAQEAGVSVTEPATDVRSVVPKIAIMYEAYFDALQSKAVMYGWSLEELGRWRGEAARHWLDLVHASGAAGD